MEMTLKRSDMREALTKIAPLRRGCLKGTSRFSMEAIPGETPTLVIVGTNPNVHTVINITTDVDIKSPGKVNFSLEGSASDVLSQCDDEVIHLTQLDSTMRVQSGKTDATIPSIEVDENQEELKPTGTLHSFRLQTNDFLTAVKKSSFVCRGETMGEITNCVAISIEDGKATFMATDRKRISMCGVPAVATTPEQTKLITVLQEEGILALSTIIEPDQEMALNITDNTVSVVTGNAETTVTKFALNFPQVSNMIPREFACTVSVSRADMINSMKHMLAINDACMALTFKGGKMMVSAKSALGEIKELHDVVSEKEFCALFKPSFLIEPLETQKAEIVNLRFVRVDAVAAVSVSGDPDYMYLVMPQNPV